MFSGATTCSNNPYFHHNKVHRHGYYVVDIIYLVRQPVTLELIHIFHSYAALSVIVSFFLLKTEIKHKKKIPKLNCNIIFLTFYLIRKIPMRSQIYVATEAWAQRQANFLFFSFFCIVEGNWGTWRKPTQTQGVNGFEPRTFFARQH